MMDYQSRMFDIKEDKDATGKTVESLLTSRNQREDILRLFDGDLPMSIMTAKRTSRGDADLSTGTYSASSQIYKEGKEVDTSLQHAFETSGRSVRGGSHGFEVSGQGAAGGALSAFPQNIGNTVIRLYSKPGDTIVDPFAGHNSRMELTVKNSRHYHGYDISEKFMQFNIERADILRKEYGMNIDLYLHDSRNMEYTRDCTGDFTLTSPPYYDIEYYGDEPGQLGKQPSYDAFIRDLKLIAYQNYRTLKPGAYCVWFVNDFRRKGKFIPYHKDVIDIMQSVGFVLHDIMIVDLGYPIRAAFASQIVEQKILPKRHEYGIVVRKK